jgi:FKBP-type peptidyl-prolyl cis-trans isomerase
MVKNGELQFKVHYTGDSTTTERFFDSSEGREPLEFTMGNSFNDPGL